MVIKNTLLLSAFAFAISVSACKVANEDNSLPPNTLSEREKSEGWQLLFDGETTKGWHLYNLGDIPSAWIVTDGVLYCNPDTFDVSHGDLVTDKSYTSFDLKFEWNISKGGNSGIFYNIQESEENPTAWTSGPEYQLLDNLGIHKEYLEDSTHWAACLYGFKPTINVAIPNPAGQWNRSRIKQDNGVVTYWLNGIKTAEQDFNTEEWLSMIADSGFKTFPNYGKTTYGKIALQDWAKGVSFKDIKIREL